MSRALGGLEHRDFAAVLFDLDGTLVDSTPNVVRPWLRWAREEGIDPRRLAGFHGVPARSITAWWSRMHRAGWSRLSPAGRVPENGV